MKQRNVRNDETNETSETMKRLLYNKVRTHEQSINNLIFQIMTDEQKKEIEKMIEGVECEFIDPRKDYRRDLSQFKQSAVRTSDKYISVRPSDLIPSLKRGGYNPSDGWTGI